MTQGVVIGKFYPPHKGHKYLIDTASSQVDKLYIIVVYRDEEMIPGRLRAKWLRQIHPNAKVLMTLDVLGDEDSKGWAEYTIKLLGFRPDVVFTSEDYGDPYAKFMKCRHVLVDKARKVVPVSGTKVRSNPLKYLEFLEPVVRAYFVKRVAIVGAESTGTTTLSRALAEKYHTAWVPEYGRFYSEGKATSRHGQSWETNEFIHIAKAQNQIEDEMAKFAHGILFCDTNAFATWIWHERYVGLKSKLVKSIADKRDYDFYILTGDEIPFVDDGLRDGEHIRHWMHQRFIEELTREKKDFIEIRGSYKHRLAVAVKAVREKLGLDEKNFLNLVSVDKTIRRITHE